MKQETCKCKRIFLHTCHMDICEILWIKVLIPYFSSLRQQQTWPTHVQSTWLCSLNTARFATISSSNRNLIFYSMRKKNKQQDSETTKQLIIPCLTKLAYEHNLLFNIYFLICSLELTGKYPFVKLLRRINRCGVMNNAYRYVGFRLRMPCKCKQLDHSSTIFSLAT